MARIFHSTFDMRSFFWFDNLNPPTIFYYSIIESPQLTNQPVWKWKNMLSSNLFLFQEFFQGMLQEFLQRYRLMNCWFHPFRNYTRNYSKDSSKKIARTILAEMSPMLSLGLLQGLNFNNFFKDFCKYFSNDKFRNAKISPDSHLWNFFNNNSGHFFKNSARDRDRFREFTRNSSTDSTLNYFMNSLSHTFKKITT